MCSSYASYKPVTSNAGSAPLVSLRCTWYSALVATALYLFNGVGLVGPFSALRKGNALGEIHSLFFDAGSTGTRLHVFTFYNSTDGLLQLKEENYFHTQPGLSSFARDPKKVRSSLRGLLKEAQRIVPQNLWAETSVSLKATAGLRLLPQDVADQILKEVYQELKEADLKIEEKNGVSIMDGEDEGFFAWYTVNYLLGRLNDTANSVATFDLGGGSIQVAFQPDKLQTYVLSPKSHITTKHVLGKPTNLYVHSYLGLGLMSARMGILQSTSHFLDSSNHLSTPCFYPNKSRAWTFHGQEFIVTGMNSTNFGYSACYHQAKAFVSGKVFSPKELRTRRIFALSYFFDRAADAGLIDRVNGGTISLKDLLNASKKVCSHYIEDKLFLCLDLTYITTLLHNGMGFDLDKKIKLVKKIASVEASWVLGAAYSHLR